MEVSLIKIGNSRGVRLPKKVIDQCQIENTLQLTVEDGKIILEPQTDSPRSGWEEAALQASQEQDELSELTDILADEEILEW